MRKVLFTMTLSCVAILFSMAQNIEVWQSLTKDAAIEKKVNDLLQKMTLEEKIGQMTQFASPGALTTGATVDPNMADYIKKGEVGSILNAVSLPVIKNLQKMAVEQTRLAIPILFGLDVVHGYQTVFPIPLAEACSWNLPLIEKTARIAAIEASSDGIQWTFAPMVDISRDPRWGRVMEGAGEDPYLGAEIAKARVRGFQGNDGFAATNKVLACVKHFAAYGAAEAGRDYNPVDISLQTLYNVYFPPYKAAVDEGAATVMTSFNELNGIPCTANKWLLTDVLRKQWKFGGMIVTDYTSLNEMLDHGNVRDLYDAATQAVNAGVDMDMQGKAYLQNLKKAVEQGLVSIQNVNNAVCRILELKFALGLFDDPYHYCHQTPQNALPDALAVAHDMAKQSIVLLKNKNQLLPLSSNKYTTIALIGPMVKDTIGLNGEWAGVGKRLLSESLYQEIIKNAGPTKIKFLYAKGCNFNDNDIKGFNEAINIAKQADIVICAMGEDFNMSGEAASRANIQLPGVQRDLLKAIKKTGKPVALVLMNGRPLELSWEDENLDAIVETWYLGRKSGVAIADVLWGKYNPSGKLVMTFPRSVGQIPIYYNHKNTGRPLHENNPKEDYRSSYYDLPNSPLYPFGYGLSYTNFEIANVSINKNELTGSDSIIVKATIKNIGKYDGENTIQLYIRDMVGSMTRPLKELKGFQKIFLRKGESKEFSFVIKKETLKFYNYQLQYIAEPGNFTLWVAQHAQDNTHPLSFVLK